MTAEFEVWGGGGGGGAIHSCNAHTRMTALFEQALKVDLSLARAALSKVNQTPHFKTKRERAKENASPLQKQRERSVA